MTREEMSGALKSLENGKSLGVFYMPTLIKEDLLHFLDDQVNKVYKTGVTLVSTFLNIHKKNFVWENRSSCGCNSPSDLFFVLDVMSDFPFNLTLFCLSLSSNFTALQLISSFLLLKCFLMV